MKKTSRAKDILARIDARAAELAERARRAGKKFPTTDRGLSLAAIGSTDTLRSIRRNIQKNPKATISLPVIELFARYLLVNEEWLLSETGPKEIGETDHIDSAQIAAEMDDESRSTMATVPIVGYVGAGAEAHFYAVAQGNLDVAPAPMDATPSSVAVEIRGTSIGAMFDRWLVYYDDVRSPVTTDLIGRLCVVGTADGRILVKKIKRAKLPGTYDLISETEPAIEAVSLEWAARVKQLSPQ